MSRMDDFLVWGLTDGATKLGYDWDSRVAWEEAVPSYLREEKLEKAEQAVATETMRLLFLANNRGAAGTGYDESRSVYPDGIVFARQCVAHLCSTFSAPMAAYILDVIDLQDLAKLCYDGDVFKAQDEVKLAIASLKGWFNEKPS